MSVCGQHACPASVALLCKARVRVAALILEEIAIDTQLESTRKRLLSEADDLHLQSLTLARNTFGESNVQTAKHYGNLGRLYQSMQLFEVRVTQDATCVT